MYRITTKKANSNSINEYTTIHHNYNEELSKYRLELEFIISDENNVFRQNIASDEAIEDSIIVQAAKELLAAANKPHKSNPNVKQVRYRGLDCSYNSNTDKHYFGFSLGLLKLVHIDPNEPTKKPRQHRSELTRCKALIRSYCMNWVTIEINEDTIIEKLL